MPCIKLGQGLRSGIQRIKSILVGQRNLIRRNKFTSQVLPERLSHRENNPALITLNSLTFYKVEETIMLWVVLIVQLIKVKYLQENFPVKVLPLRKDIHLPAGLFILIKNI